MRDGMRLQHILFVGLFIASPACAGFKADPAPTSWGIGQFECAVVSLIPRDNDKDPVYKINISLSFNDLGTLIDLEATHVRIVGKPVARSEQYSNSSLRQVPGKLEVYWTGVRNNLRMVGKFWNDALDKHWYYEETLFRTSGAVDMRMHSICHLNEQE